MRSKKPDFKDKKETVGNQNIEISRYFIHSLIENLTPNDMTALGHRWVKTSQYYIGQYQQQVKDSLGFTINFLTKQRAQVKNLLSALRYSYYATKHLKEEALRDPIVIETIKVLRFLGYKKKSPISERKLIKKKLDNLILKQLRIDLSGKGRTERPYCLDLLLEFDKEKERVKKKLKKRYNNPSAKMIDLKELYPNLSISKNWKDLSRPNIPHFVLAKKYNIKTSTLKDWLWQAKKETRWMGQNIPLRHFNKRYHRKCLQIIKSFKLQKAT